ncbi:acetyltransferase [Colletotrichum orchidophilum]|uniref:Acetyltransferase n=1 Tax=Colletotrichum orchidophilum TaxID=1209926 RepID=A0A1G4AZ73_9PEZI|nr:acetyltransferase [Colletotrichum orchidophilum]OHE94395.1 acetyltransferase [Colletotrichum orchidophilum]
MGSSQFRRASYEIVSPRLIIRTATDSDTESFLAIMTAPENFPFEKPEQGLTLDKLRTRIDKFAKMSAEGQNAFMVVELRDTRKLVGYGGYNTFGSIDPAEFLSETTLPAGKTYLTDIGIIVDHKHWRKGYGLESVSALIEYARNELGCEVFRAETGDDNEPWRALMRAAGLAKFEGRHKASYDPSQEVWVWKFDAGHWRREQERMRKEGKWPL